jgi:hypothetical protein
MKEVPDWHFAQDETIDVFDVISVEPEIDVRLSRNSKHLTECRVSVP